MLGATTLRIHTDDRGNSGGGNEIDDDTVAIYVAPVDHPTVAADDSGTIGEDTPGTIDVLGNDSDADGPLAVLAVDGTAITVGNTVAVANGSVTLNADGTLTFTPAGDFNGATAFSYQTREALHYQFFDRDIETAFTTVASIPTEGGVEGFANDFNVAALAAATQRQRRLFRRTLHRLDQYRDRRQLHVLHHLGRRLGAVHRRRDGREQRFLAGAHRALRRRRR